MDLARGFRDQLASAYDAVKDGQGIDTLALTETEVAGHEPVGLLPAANEWLQQLEEEGRVHMQMAAKASSDVADELHQTISLLGDARSHGLDTYQKLLSERDKVYEAKDKARAQYEARTKVLGAAQQKQERATSEKDQEKFRQKAERDAGQRNQAKNEYILQVAVSNEIKRAINHTLTPRVMDRMQSVNERRVAAARRLLLLLLEMQETAESKRLAGTRRAAQVMARVTPEADSLQFVRRRIDGGLSAWDEPPDFRVVVDYAGGENDNMALDGESQAILRNMCLQAQREGSRAEQETRARMQAAEQSKQKAGTDEKELLRAADAEREATMAELEAVQYQAVRAAVEQRLGPVDQGSPHEFKSITVAISKTCDYCGESIGGFSRKAAKCTLCDYTCHAKCQLKVEPNCAGPDPESKGGFLSLFGTKRGGRRASKSVHRRSMSALSGESASSSFDSAGQQHQLPPPPHQTQSQSQMRMSMLSMPASGTYAQQHLPLPMPEEQSQPALPLRTPNNNLASRQNSRSESFETASHGSNSAYGAALATAAGSGGGSGSTTWQRAPIPLTAAAASSTAAAAAAHSTAAAAHPTDSHSFVTVLYDFSGDGSTTLSVSAGNKVRVVEADDDGSGWTEVALDNGQQGMVPTSYVDMSEYHKPAQKEAAVATAATAALLPVSRKADATEDYVIALYDFSGRDSDELSFRAGDRIRVVSRDIGEGWLQGALGSNEGRLPVSYVEDE
ncbi:hypothetical protein BX070DRAFT_229041 [Coemansia spiralis]|nr:hypothetical protein BX070DRAFT_229041 [Coemansia spiralis]